MLYRFKRFIYLFFVKYHLKVKNIDNDFWNDILYYDLEEGYYV